MAFQISPGVNVSEIDLTTVIPAVSTTVGAIAGQFRWGPVEQPVLLSTEDQIAETFQKPTASFYKDFFTAANFLSYANALYVVRAVNTSDAQNAILDSSNNAQTLVKSDEDYDANYASGITGVGDFIAKYPGDLGNSLKVSVCASANAFEETLQGVTYNITTNTATLTTSTDQSGKIKPGDFLIVGPDLAPEQVKSVSTTTVTLVSRYQGNTVSSGSGLVRRWEYFYNVDRAPGTSTYVSQVGGSNDELHVVVADEDALWTGTANTPIEVFSNLSFASDAKAEDGTSVFYKDVINSQSKYLWWTAHNANNVNAGSAATAAFSGAFSVQTQSFVYGNNGSAATSGNIHKAYDKFQNKETYDISFLLAAANEQTTVTHLINNIAEVRKDCLVCFSPRQSNVLNNNSYAGKEAADIITYRNLLPSSSYATMDSGYKYQYDKYNDVYRYIPLNGDIAGLMARTDQLRDAWFSPAGFNRGNIKNVIKLAYNPNKAERDLLYKSGINPIVSFPGQGTVMFGDKTLLAKPSAFDRINVRRLFIVLQKAISTASQFTLFEFNDDFTRAQFVNLVEPFLRDVQGRRGITDFRVVCDETNNTGEVIDRNEFVGDIYIKPARSINFIQLNFVAVRSGVEFSEVVGQF